MRGCAARLALGSVRPGRARQAYEARARGDSQCGRHDLGQTGWWGLLRGRAVRGKLEHGRSDTVFGQVHARAAAGTVVQRPKISRVTSGRQRCTDERRASAADAMCRPECWCAQGGATLLRATRVRLDLARAWLPGLFTLGKRLRGEPDRLAFRTRSQLGSSRPRQAVGFYNAGHERCAHVNMCAACTASPSVKAATSCQ